VVTFVALMWRLSARERATSTRMRIELLEEVVARYKADHGGACPATLDAIAPRPVDAWGERFAFRCPGIHDEAGADIVSKGPDRVLGTDDDVWSWGVQ
jgi:hypothetical protein